MEYLKPSSGEVIIDGTLGGGGYAMAISKAVGEKGRVIALDIDEAAINNAKLKIKKESVKNLELIQANFKDLDSVVKDCGVEKLDGVVLDLGLSSAQLEDDARGFSFKNDSPLNMAFGSLIDTNTTEDIINNTPVSSLTSLIKDFGEERYARQIAHAIGLARKNKPIRTTGELVEIIARAVPASYRRSRIHFATRTFQAIRIATNKELDNLRLFLEETKNILKPGARIVIVSFHSLEDRIVKQFFKKESRDCICPLEMPICSCNHKAWLEILTKKAATPTEEEIKENPRSRSAKLRAVRIIN